MVIGWIRVKACCTVLPNKEQRHRSADAVRLVQISDLLGVEPDDLMAVMAFESRLDPTNQTGGATGLIQFMPSTASRIGTSSDELVKMSGVEQLDYVYEYLKSKSGRLNNLGDLYMKVLWPSGIGKNDDYVLWSTTHYPKYYRLNKGLDINNDGKVQKYEAVQKVTNRRDSYSKKGVKR